MNNILYDLLYKASRLATYIADYLNDKFEAEFNRREAIAEEEYNRIATEFYEISTSYYGNKE